MSLEERLKEVRERAERAKQKIDENSKQRLLKELHMSWECVKQSLTETVDQVLPFADMLLKKHMTKERSKGYK